MCMVYIVFQISVVIAIFRYENNDDNETNWIFTLITFIMTLICLSLCICSKMKDNQSAFTAAFYIFYITINFNLWSDHYVDGLTGTDDQKKER